MHARGQGAQRDALVDRYRKLMHDLAGSGGDDLRAQDLAVGSVDYLDKPAQILVGYRAVEMVELPAGDLNVVIAGNFVRASASDRPH